MLTRKQQWRRTRTRKQAWGNLPPEVLEAMLTAGAGGGLPSMPKSISWDHSYAAGLKLRAARAARAVKEGARAKATAAAAAVAGAATSSSAAGGKGGGAGAEAAHIPRSASCSSLGPKRTLFPRSSSRDDLRESADKRRMSNSRRRILPRRKTVTFNTQVSEPTRVSLLLGDTVEILVYTLKIKKYIYMLK